MYGILFVLKKSGDKNQLRGIIVQPYSEKCTEIYFKVRDDDLSSEKGTLCTLKMILIELLENIFKYIFTHIKIFVIKLIHNMNIF